MTINSTQNRVSYAGNGVTVNFSFPYLFLQNADLVVLLVTDATGVTVTQMLSTDYTVTGALNPGGGTVSMVAPPATGKTLIIYRDPAVTQLADYVANDSFPAETHERALDLLTMIAQRTRDLVLRTLRQPDSDSVNIDLLPAKVLRASKYLAFDAEGDPIATDGTVNASPISAFMATVVDDANAAAAFTTLGVTAYIQTLFDDANAPAARATLGSGAGGDAVFIAATERAAQLAMDVYKKAGDVASAATLNLDTLDGDLADVTGNTGITAITLAEGKMVMVRFTGTPLITVGANLVLNNDGKNIQINAGDFGLLRGYAAGIVRGFIVRANGQPLRLNSFERPIGIIKQGWKDLAQNSTSYGRTLGHTGDGTENNIETFVLRPFTMRELRAFAANALPGGNSAVFTVRKNGADTGLTCTIGAGQTVAADVANSVNFGFGDRFSIKCVTSATAGTNDYTVTARVDQPGTTLGLGAIFYHGHILSGGNCYAEFGGTLEFGANRPAFGMPLPKCLITDYLEANSSAVLRLYKNNAQFLPASIDTTVRDKMYGEDALFVEDNDHIAGDAAGANANSCGQVYFKAADGEYDPCPAGFTSPDQAQNTTIYMGGLHGSGSSATESEVQIPMPACTVRNLRGRININPPAGQTMTVTVRKNGVDTALTIQYSNGANQSQADTVNSVTFAAGDLLSIKGVSSATLGTASHSASLEMFELVTT